MQPDRNESNIASSLHVIGSYRDLTSKVSRISDKRVSSVRLTHMKCVIGEPLHREAWYLPLGLTGHQPVYDDMSVPLLESSSPTSQCYFSAHHRHAVCCTRICGVTTRQRKTHTTFHFYLSRSTRRWHTFPIDYRLSHLCTSPCKKNPLTYTNIYINICFGLSAGIAGVLCVDRHAPGLY